jgi:uncharacterized protein
MDMIKLLSNELGLEARQVTNTVKLIDDNNTIPFIARYRKEATGGLSDDDLRRLYERLHYLRALCQKKEDVARRVQEQNKLTEALSAEIEKAQTLQELEDLYRPYKQKRKTRAVVAIDKGLEPLAKVILEQNTSEKTIEMLVEKYLSDEVQSMNEAIGGAKDIIAERISDCADYRKKIRHRVFQEGFIVTKAKKKEESVYEMYYEYAELVKKIPGHRILAINRGENEEYLSVKIDIEKSKCTEIISQGIITNRRFEGHRYLEEAIEDSYQRLIFPSIEREIRSQITQEAQENAMRVFSENLKKLVMQPPIRGKVVLALDPAFRTGCKVAVVDDTGRPLNTTVIYPTPPHNKLVESMKVLDKLVKEYHVSIIAIGNGTASRETESFVAAYIREYHCQVKYIIVNEAGASVYSASKLGSEEFPEYDVAVRSAISIARRLQDPLAELVKIDPKSIGVGQYQHDMNQKKLGEALSVTVEACVNKVGVELNTASPSLLSYVAGVNHTIALNIVTHRKEIGRFSKRNQLKKVKKLGVKAFEQCAGFLRISDSDDFLERTSVHPESYHVAKSLLERLGVSYHKIESTNLEGLMEQVQEIGLSQLAEELGVGLMTLKDILSELSKPGRDPRDELPKPILMTDVLQMEDLVEGMILKGTVRNVADFGAFVDIGVHQDGLVHVSEISNRFIRNPLEVLSVGDVVTVKVKEVNMPKRRISLSMKDV